jgi:RimJ/RimL family protein N-acetyltransferase
LTERFSPPAELPIAMTQFTTKSGHTIEVRDIKPDDAGLLVDLFYHLSPETIYRRFHMVIDPETVPRQRIEEMAAQLSQIDPTRQVALAAVHEGVIIGVARFHRVPNTTDAESAIVIRDDYQREGIGTHLLALLRDHALQMGISHLIAMVQAQNHPIVKVIQRSGLDCRWRFEQGESFLAVDIQPPAE